MFSKKKSTLVSFYRDQFGSYSKRALENLFPEEFIRRFFQKVLFHEEFLLKFQICTFNFPRKVQSLISQQEKNSPKACSTLLFFRKKMSLVNSSRTISFGSSPRGNFYQISRKDSQNFAS